MIRSVNEIRNMTLDLEKQKFERAVEANMFIVEHAAKIGNRSVKIFNGPNRHMMVEEFRQAGYNVEVPEFGYITVSW